MNEGSLLSNVRRVSLFLYCSLLLIGFLLVLPDSALRPSLWLVYLTHFALIVAVTLRLRDRWLFVLSPSFMTLASLGVFCALGALVFSSGRVLLQDDYHAYLDWQHLRWTSIFFILAQSAVLLAYFVGRGSERAPQIAAPPEQQHASFEIFCVALFSLGMFVVFSFVELDLSFIGGDGNFAIFPKTIAALSLALLIGKFQFKGRALMYLAILLYFASFSYEDKREAFFLAAPIVLVEAARASRLAISLRGVLFVALAFVLSLYLIIMMSIYRGYGDYNPESFLDSSNFVSDYLRDEKFIEYIANNLEVSYTFYHLHQAVEYAIADPSVVVFGSTFLKVLFIPIPRYLYPNKPLSIIELYTGYHAPHYRAIGGSWVSTIYAEFFWNFHFLSIPALFLFYYLLNYLYFKLVGMVRAGVSYDQLFGLYSYQQLLELIRGSGIDQFVTYLIVAWGLCTLGFRPLLKLFQSRVAQQHIVRAR